MEYAPSQKDLAPGECCHFSRRFTGPCPGLPFRAGKKDWCVQGSLGSLRLVICCAGVEDCRMKTIEWWPKLDAEAQAWLIEHNGEVLG